MHLLMKKVKPLYQQILQHAKIVSPTNIRKLLLVPEKNKSPNKRKSDKKIIVNKSCISLEENTEDKLVINGKIYRSINKTLT